MTAAPVDYDGVTSRGPHRLAVVGYDETHRSHQCLVDGRKSPVLVDIMVDGALPDELTPQDLIGKTVEVAFTHGFVWIASEPRIASDLHTLEVASP